MLFIPADQAVIRFVYSKDFSLQGCVLRTLLGHPDLEPGIFLLTMSAVEDSLNGFEYEESSIDLSKWRKLETPVPWVKGLTPIVDSNKTFSFKTKSEIHEMKLRKLTQVIEDALFGSKSLLSRVSAVEYMDSRMGGNPLSLATLIVLANRIPKGHPDEDIFGEYTRLQDRFNKVAPQGVDSLREVLALMKAYFTQDVSSILEDGIMNPKEKFSC